MLGSTEIIVLVVVIGVLIFGAKKIPELAKHLVKPKENLRKEKFKEIKNSKTLKAK
jgi:mttA/Hcf106 family.